MGRPVLFGIALLISMGMGSSAQAALIAFDFNTLGDSDGNSKVQTYMNGVLTTAHPGGSVTVHGSEADKDYDGDDHVVGPVISNKVKSNTLGTGDGGIYRGDPLDAFIMNSGSDRITMTFNFPIYAVSFDYEIFADGTCPDGTKNSCNEITDSNWPDFKLIADGDLVFQAYGVLPGTNGLPANSPDSGKNKTEKAPQWLGLSGWWYFEEGVTKLEFVDWPRAIGIDNLIIEDECYEEEHPPEHPGDPIPEPASLMLLGSGLLGVVGGRIRSRVRRTNG